ncbi:hypothetical protein, partial [Spirosoma terrae]
HRCKFTGKLFCSPIRRVTYSNEGLKLKKEQDQQIKEARKLSCRLYIRQCPKTKQWYSSPDRIWTYSNEGKALAYQASLERDRAHRQKPEVKERERIRSQRRWQAVKQRAAATNV